MFLRIQKSQSFKGLLLAASIGIGMLVCGCGSSNSSEPANNTKQSSSVQRPKRQAKYDLSLDGFSLGEPRQDVVSVFGQPKKEKKDGKMLHYYYDGIFFSFVNDKIVGIVTDGGKFETKRGFHEGSAWDDVKKSYGANYTEDSEEGAVLYEYELPAFGNRKGLIRFAVKPDKKVDYISVRLLPDEAEMAAERGRRCKIGNAVWEKKFFESTMPDKYGTTYMRGEWYFDKNFNNCYVNKAGHVRATIMFRGFSETKIVDENYRRWVKQNYPRIYKSYEPHYTSFSLMSVEIDLDNNLQRRIGPMMDSENGKDFYPATENMKELNMPMDLGDWESFNESTSCYLEFYREHYAEIEKLGGDR